MECVPTSSSWHPRLDINDAGVVLGEGDLMDGRIRSFIWIEETGIQELNTLIDPASGWTIISAGDINNAGQIIGYGNYLGETRYFLMTPVPEPSAWALQGLGGLGWWLRRLWRRRE